MSGTVHWTEQIDISTDDFPDWWQQPDDGDDLWGALSYQDGRVTTTVDFLEHP